MLNSVWIVVLERDYEGIEILNVTSTLAKAFDIARRDSIKYSRSSLLDWRWDEDERLYRAPTNNGQYKIEDWQII